MHTDWIAMVIKPKILMFGWEFPPFNSGGLGVACHGLTQALSQEDVAITFVLPRKLNLSLDYLNILFADTSEVSNVAERIASPYIGSSYYSYLRSRMQDSNYKQTLFEEVDHYTARASDIARNTHHDIIHAHDWLTFGAGMEASRVSGKPFVAHVHSTEFDRTGGNGVNQQVYDVERLGLEKSDAIIAVSNFTKQTLMSEYGIDESKIMVIHNGIDPETYAFQMDSGNEFIHLRHKGLKIVLFVGRFTLQKGPEYFLRVAKRVAPFEPKALFVMAGAGEMEGEMMQMAAENLLSDKVLFTGFLRDDKLSKLYKSSDLFCMTSVSEPFGITALESIIHGTPVLLSNQTGVSEVVSNVLKTDFWDIDDMANKIISVLRYPSLKETLSQNATQEISHMTWQNIAKKCMGVYHKILQN